MDYDQKSAAFILMRFLARLGQRTEIRSGQYADVFTAHQMNTWRKAANAMSETRELVRQLVH